MTDNVIKVLLLEDNPTDVLLLQAALESDLLNTFSLTTAEKLSQGLSLLDQESFDLILLDLSLPDSHGFETFEQLHQRDASPPIIILSGNTDEQAAILAVRAGAQDYIVKDAASLAILARSIRYAVERQQIQLELRTREKYWRTLIEQSVEAITLVAADGAILYKSPAAMPILGYTMEELEGRNALELVFPEDRTAAAQSFIQSMNQLHQPIFSQARFIRKDGTLCWVEATTTNWLDDPALGAIVINYRDITQHKQMEEALRQSEQQMRSLVTSLDDIVFEIDEQGRYLNVWTADESLLAQPKAQLLGRRLEEVLGEEKGCLFTEIVQRVVARGNPESVEYCLEIGDEQRWFMARTSPILAQDDAHRTVSMLVQDITARKQTEELVQAQRDLARITGMITSAEAAWPLCQEVALRVSGMDSGGIYLFDPAGQVLQLIYQQGLGADFVQTVSCYPADAPNVQLILSGQSSYYDAAEITRIEYAQREGLKSIGAIPIQHQKRVLGCVNIASHTVSEISSFARQALETIAAEIGNIVASLHTASLLRESEERFRTLYETMTQGIVYHDAEGSIISANPAAERILGLTLDQMQGRSSIDPRWRAIHEDGAEFPGETHPAIVALRTGSPVNNVVMGVFHPQAERHVWININATPPIQTRPNQTLPGICDL
ncbi:MAG: PAS domain S-box protein [Anaerolineales bacterium]|nr:PAS domain S-box protein [Anaerolineales bacterium]